MSKPIRSLISCLKIGLGVREWLHLLPMSKHFYLKYILISKTISSVAQDMEKIDFGRFICEAVSGE